LNCAEDCDWPSPFCLFVTDVTQKHSEYCLSGQENGRNRATKCYQKMIGVTKTSLFC